MSEPSVVYIVEYMFDDRTLWFPSRECFTDLESAQADANARHAKYPNTEYRAAEYKRVEPDERVE